MATCTNENLNKAQIVQNDEFYTQYIDIKTELDNYKDSFKDKTIFLPCDDAESEFWHYLSDNFSSFGLRKLIATHYTVDGIAYKKIMTEDSIQKKNLTDNGGFQTAECGDLLNECDIVITNPPFSLYRDFIKWIMAARKQFLVICSQNAFTYKEVFPLIRDNEVWVGYNMVHDFRQPDKTIKKFGNVCWMTNIENQKRKEKIELKKTYTPEKYPFYDNYPAIETGRVDNIPANYTGAMGVPITFINKYNPEQFKILACSAYSDEEAGGAGSLYINNNKKFPRVIIKKV